MLSFGGHDLESLFKCGNPVLTWHNSVPDYIEVPGRDGAAVRGSRFGLSTVSFAIAAIGTAAARRAALSTLGSWLDVDAPARLVLPDTPDRYYMAMPSGPVQMTRGCGAEMAALAFDIVEPAAYGATRTATVPSGGSVTITVNGTYPTAPKIYAASAVRDSSALVWGIRMDSGDFVHLDTGTASARRVDIDCAARTSTITASRTAKLLTLDSDWLVMKPGSHVLQMDKGTGAATVTWVERWL